MTRPDLSMSVSLAGSSRRRWASNELPVVEPVLDHAVPVHVDRADRSCRLGHPEYLKEQGPQRLGITSRDTEKRRSPPDLGGGGEGASASVLIDSYREQDALASCLCSHFLPKLSNSPFRTPPRKACHSSDVNRRTGPSESRLLRTPISPPGRLATSTQLPLEKLRELLTQ